MIDIDKTLYKKIMHNNVPPDHIRIIIKKEKVGDECDYVHLYPKLSRKQETTNFIHLFCSIRLVVRGK